MNEVVELHRIISIILRRWWVLLVLTALAAGASYMISKRQTPVYEATATVLVGQITQSANVSREDAQISAMFAQTYADLAVRQPVLRGVVEMLGLNETWEELRERVQVSPIDSTQLIEINAEANSPEMARNIADEIAKHLVLIGPANLSDSEGDLAQNFIHQQMEDTRARILAGQNRIKQIEADMDGSVSATKLFELQTEKSNLERLVADHVLNYIELSNLAAQDRKPNSLSVIETAHSSIDPIRPRVNLNTILGGGLGLLLAFGLIFLWEFLDDTVKSADDLSQFEQLNILGAIGRIKGKKYSEKIVTQREPSSPTTEMYRMIRNKIRLGSVNHPAKSIVVTSPESGEGKSITAANLGVIMAQANIQTILVDANLRNPVLHQTFNVELKSGLADLLSSPEMDLQACLKSTSIKNLQIITSGDPFQDQSERLRSDRISEILNCLEELAEVVIIDSPPALLDANATVLSNQADGVLVVIRAGKSKGDAIRQTLIDLQEANANLLGGIYNLSREPNNIGGYKRHKPKRSLLLRWNSRQADLPSSSNPTELGASSQEPGRTGSTIKHTNERLTSERLTSEPLTNEQDDHSSVFNYTEYSYTGSNGHRANGNGKRALVQFTRLEVYCPNEDCPDYKKHQNQTQKNIILSGKANPGAPRYWCKTCGKSFTGTTGTIFFQKRRRNPR